MMGEHERLLKSIQEELASLRRLIKSPPARMLDSPQTARYIGISLKTLREGIYRNGKRCPLPIRAKRIGRKKLYDIKELDRFIDSLE